MIQRASSSRWNPHRSLSLLGSMLRGREKRLRRRRSAPTIGVAVERLEDRTLLDASAPEILMPLGETGDPTPTFEWTSGTDVERYDLMVRNLETGERPIRENQLTSTSFTPTTDLAEGDYRVYIRAFHTDGTKSDWDSGLMTIDLAQADPELLAPLDVTPDTTPTFKWSAGSDVERYDLMVRNLDTGERPIRENELLQNSFTPATDLAEGNYRAYIRAFKTDGTKSDWDSLSFTIDTSSVGIDIDMSFTAQPMLLAPGGDTSDATPDFNWTASENVERYDLMVRNLDTGEKPIREKYLTSTSFTPTTDLPEGNYRAYVRAFFADGTNSSWDSLQFTLNEPLLPELQNATLTRYDDAVEYLLPATDGAGQALSHNFTVEVVENQSAHQFTPAQAATTWIKGGQLLRINPADDFVGTLLITVETDNGTEVETRSFLVEKTEVTDGSNARNDPEFSQSLVEIAGESVPNLQPGAPTKIKAYSGGAGKAPTVGGGLTQLIPVGEAEPVGVSGANDTQATGEFIAGFGTGAGDDPEATIGGSLAAAAAPAPLAVGAEDDGSIPLATATGLAAGSSVIVTGAFLGDGPHGSGASGSGDFDFFEISGVMAGQTITVDVDTPVPFGDLDSTVAIWDSAGTLLAFNDDDGISFDSFVQFVAPADDTYFVSVQGLGSFPGTPFNSASGAGFGSEGVYDVTIGLNSTDLDFFTFDVEAGDVIGASVSGAAGRLTFFDDMGVELVGSGQDLSFIYPAASPLPGGGNAVLAYVAATTGTYALAVQGGTGAYSVDLNVFRPELETQEEGNVQTLFIDFDGATVNASIFGGAGIANLSPLATFLPNWGLDATDEDAVIDAILAELENSISTDIRLNGNNGDFDLTGIDGDFDIEILNSRDHADPFGQENVSRVIVGGSISELGVSTIGIAESIDPGNFDTTESAVVLLDLLSAGAGDPNSLNSIPLGGGATIIDLIGVGVGNITSHEAGHFFGLFHTDQFNGTPNLIDQGGNLGNTIGLGPDGIFGTADDVTVLHTTDVYVPSEGFTGNEDTKNALAFALSTGAVPEPPRLSIDDVEVVEGDVLTTTASFTVTLSVPVAVPVMVDFEVFDGTAQDETGDNDYLSNSGTLTFMPGDPLTQTVDVTINGDTKPEPDEFYQVVLSSPVNAEIEDGMGIGTILNDDGLIQPGISINSVSVIEGNTVPAFSFGGVTPLTVGAAPLDVGALDRDGDGDLDLIAAPTAPDLFSLLNNDGTGTFAPVVNFPGTPGTFQVAFGDFNNDGTQDLALTSEASAEVFVELTNLDGTVTEVIVPVGMGVFGIAPADFDGDGNTDLVTANVTDNTLTLLINDGTGMAFTPTVLPTAGTGSTFVAVADVDNDTDIDLIVSNATSDNISVLRNNGAGVFGPAATFALPATAAPADLVVADFDGDGLVDIAVASSGLDSASILLNLGAGAFGASTEFAVGTAPGDLVQGDFDVDGDLDLAVANTLSDNVTILENDGTGTFTTATTIALAPGSSPEAITAADIDKDGDLDIATSDFGTSTVSVIDNTLDPSFAEFTVSLFQPSTRAISVDFDTADATALSTTDYSSTSGTLTFFPGVTSQTVAIPIIGDLVAEATETFRVDLSNATNGNIVDTPGIGTILDDDTANMAVIVIDDASVVEGNLGDTVTMEFTVRLSLPAPAMGVTVDFTTDDTAPATATEDTDYVGDSDTIVFAAGQTEQTITIDIIPDNIIEGNETFFVNLSDAVVVGGGLFMVTIEDDQAIGTIIDDDAGSIHGVKYNDLNANQIRDMDGGGGLDIELAPIGPVILARNDDGSTNAIDLGFDVDFFGNTFNQFFINNNGNVTFGDSLFQFTAEGFPTTFGIPIIAPFWADVDTRPAASAEVHLATGTSTRGNPFVQVDWPGVGYFANNTNLLNTFTLYIEDSPTGDIVAFVYGDMEWTTGDASGGVGGFGGEGAQIGFDAGDGVNFLSLGRPNSAPEVAALSNQMFVFVLGPGGVPMSGFEPGLPGVTIYVDENDNGELDPGEPFTITAEDDLSTPEDETGRFWFLDLPEGDYTIREVVPPLDGFIQTAPELGGNGSFEVELGPGDVVFNDNSTGFLEFGNIEFTPSDVSIDDVTMFEGDVGTTQFTFTVSLSQPSIIPVTVDFTTMDGTATLADMDYVMAAGTLNFAPGVTTQQVTVSVVGDRRIEPDETFTVVLTGATNANLADDTGVGFILDDDTPQFNILDAFQILGDIPLEGDVADPVSFVREDVAVATPPNDLDSLDIDGDGDMDLLVGTTSPTSAAVLANTGGTFVPFTTVAGDGLVSLVTDDFNRDGTQDSAAVDAMSDTVIVGFLDTMLGGTFIGVPVGAGALGLATADFNADMLPDLVTANSTDGTVSVLLNVGGVGFFRTDVGTGGVAPEHVTTGDFDGDGDIDIAVSNSDSDDVSILLNTGGVFALSSVVGVGMAPAGLAAGDLDGDGVADLAVTNADDDTVSILLSDGMGTFTLAATLETGTAPVDVVIADLDLDGDNDLATANSGSDDVSLFVNNGMGAFLPLGRPFVGDKPVAISAVDVDNDGDLDLVTANEDSSDVTVLTNQVDPTVVVFTVEYINDSDSAASVAFSTTGFDAIAGVDFIDTSGVITTFPTGVETIFTRQIVVPIIPDVVPENFVEQFSVTLSDPINSIIANPTGFGAIRDDDDVVVGQTISGTKFVDENANGIRDLVAFSDEPDLVFVIDVSGTTSTKFNPFLSTGIGDINNDLFPDTVLDAQLSALIGLNRQLADAGLDETTEISIVVFGGFADALDMNPALAGVQLSTSPLADADGDGQLDVEQILRSIKVGQNDTDPNFSNFEFALDETIDVLTALGTEPGDGQVIFMSDGDVNGGGEYTDEVEIIEGLGADITAFAMGLNSTVDDLLPIDPDAQQITQLGMVEAIVMNQLVTYTEPGFPGVTIFLDTNGNGILDPGEVSVLTQEDDLSTPAVDETGFYSFDVEPGTYTVAEVVPVGFFQTAPASGTFVVTLEVNDMVTGLDFGNAPLTPIPTVEISIDDRTVIEGDDGTKTLSFTVSLSEASPNTVEVDFTTLDDTATAGLDYTAAAGTLTFAPGETEKTIEIETFGDLITEVNEVLFVDLSAATGGGIITDGRGIGTIIDDEAAVSLQADPRLFGKTALFIVGTDDADVIELEQVEGGQIEVVIDGENLGLYRPDETIYIITKAGDDVVTLSKLVTYDTFVFAGDGDDLVETGSGNDVVIGGLGADDIRGGYDGRDILIGGVGPDRIETSSPENFNPVNNSNIAITGSTIYDDDLDELFAIHAEWNSERSFEERMDRLSTGEDGLPVIDATTVFDEGLVDEVFSYRADGEDFILSMLEDTVNEF